MIFTSITFLIFFLVVLGLVFSNRNNSSRIYILLLASYFFYGWWNPTFILLIFVSSLWGWYFGLLIDRSKSDHQKSIYLAISLALSVGLLVYFKYAEFLAIAIFSALGLGWHYELDITLPVGISFFTFQTMSYSIDLKRGVIPVCTSLPKFMLFVAFFPQLVAGPIVRASEFLPQLDKKIELKQRNFVVGSQIFLGGSLQKVLIADNLSTFVDPVFADPAMYSAATLWLALAAYSVQIFCDFCGYSLMAIGIAKVLGFELPENFRMPYLSKSIDEFWRRWHMSLSFWLRDYLYISFGGNRKGTSRTYLHLLATMLLGGLWHGASWNFVLWGALHGFALAIHRYWEAKTSKLSAFKSTRIYRVVAWMLTLLFVSILWVPFRSADFTTMRTFLFRMFGNYDGVEWLNPHVFLLLGTVIVWHWLYEFKGQWLGIFPSVQLERFSIQFALGLCILMVIMFAPLRTSPFVYFQF